MTKGWAGRGIALALHWRCSSYYTRFTAALRPAGGPAAKRGQRPQSPPVNQTVAYQATLPLAVPRCRGAQRSAATTVRSLPKVLWPEERRCLCSLGFESFRLRTGAQARAIVTNAAPHRSIHTDPR